MSVSQKNEIFPNYEMLVTSIKIPLSVQRIAKQAIKPTEH